MNIFIYFYSGESSKEGKNEQNTEQKGKNVTNLSVNEPPMG